MLRFSALISIAVAIFLLLCLLSYALNAHPRVVLGCAIAAGAFMIFLESVGSEKKDRG